MPLIQDTQIDTSSMIELFLGCVQREAQKLFDNATQSKHPNTNPQEHALQILALVSEQLGVSVIDICSHNRQRDIAEARMIYSYMVRQVSIIAIGCTIAAKVINHDHATVLFGNKSVQNLLDAKDKIMNLKVHRCVDAYNMRFNVMI